jgi:hypothetical protein
MQQLPAKTQEDVQQAAAELSQTLFLCDEMRRINLRFFETVRIVLEDISQTQLSKFTQAYRSILTKELMRLQSNRAILQAANRCLKEKVDGVQSRYDLVLKQVIVFALLISGT